MTTWPEGNDFIPRRRTSGINPAAALAIVALAGAKYGRETNERVVTGEAIPKAPKKQPKPPTRVERSKLPKRLFKCRPVVRVGDAEEA